MSDERAEYTRMDKAIDFLLGDVIDRVQTQMIAQSPNENKDVRRRAAVYLCSTDVLLALEATAHRQGLPNRIKLLELVESAMPKPEAKP